MTPTHAVNHNIIYKHAGAPRERKWDGKKKLLQIRQARVPVRGVYVYRVMFSTLYANFHRELFVKRISVMENFVFKPFTVVQPVYLQYAQLSQKIPRYIILLQHYQLW